MSDNLRTAIQDYFCNIMNVPEILTEDYAEGLEDYLSARGWSIVDTLDKELKDEA